MRLKKAVAKLVEWERVARVATVSPRGVPHVVPVSHVLAGGKLYFASDPDARKIRNLRASPHVAVTVDVYGDDWSHLRGVLIQGTTRLFDRGPHWRRVRTLLYEKYPQYPEESALEERETVVVEVTPRHVFSWGLD